MSEPIVWENIPKSQSDPTTIEEAIAEGVNVHNADTNAHMEENESLEQHRANDIIDHPAESIPNDKTFTSTRTYIAIVDPQSEEDFATIEAALEYAITKGGGNILVRNGMHYLSTGIVIPPNVSLIGEGGDTAVINASGVSDIPFWPKGGKTRLDMLAISIELTSGSDEVTINGLEPLQGRSMVGRVIDLPYFTGPSRAKIIADLGGGVYQVDKNALITSTLSTPQFLIGVDVVNGSSEVSLQPVDEFYAMFLLPGMNIRFGESATEYTILANNGDGTFTLDSNYTGTSGETYIRCSPVQNDFILLQDLRIYGFSGLGFRGATTSSYEWQRPTIHFERCNVAMLGSTLSLDGFVAGFRDSQIRCGSSYLIDILSAFSAENTLFIATENGSKGIANCPDVSLQSCRFLANGFTSHYWITDDVGGYRVQSCIFESTRELITYADFWTFVGNRVDMSSTYAMTIQGPQNIIGNNRITKLTLGGDSANCVCVANMTDSAITNNGTNNTVANNLVY